MELVGCADGIDVGIEEEDRSHLRPWLHYSLGQDQVRGRDLEFHLGCNEFKEQPNLQRGTHTFHFCLQGQ